MSVASIPILAAMNSGEIFRQALPYVLLGVALIVALDLAVSFVYRGNPSPRSKWNWWDVLVYLGTLGSVGVLGFTSLAAVVRDGVLGGWSLFVHMFGAGAFTAVLPLLALSWAHANRAELRPAGGQSSPPKFCGISKLMFWLILACGFVVTMTMLVSMLPIFGSDGQHTLLDIHRYSGLAVVVAAVLHLYGVAAQQVGLR
ncbi:MAG: hypothetical protein HUU20_07765 [Pirellulales bacterium]|nr:hypothetical protein [Pirellulales bacterium]